MTIDDRLSTMTGEMRVLGDLDVNERPFIDREGKISAKFNGVSGLLSAGVQALQRSCNGTQTTRQALKHIERIAEEIRRYVSISPTPFEYYMTYSNRVEQFSQLLTHITRVLDAGLPNFMNTSTSSSASVVSISESEKTEREKLFRTTTRKIEAAATKLREKVDEYNALNACASKRGLPPPEEHLYTIIEMILAPDPKLNISTMNINGYQNFCTDIARRILNESFGEEQVEEIFRFYGLEHSVRLTYPDLQAVIIGIVANMTYRDIETLLKKPDGIAYKSLESRFSKEIPETPSEKDVLVFLDILRTIDVGGAHCPRDRDYTNQLYGDLLFLESCKKFPYYGWKKSSFPDHPMIKLGKFGRVEQFAREYVFALFRTEDHRFRQGILFPSFSKDGGFTCFEGHLVYKNNGIYAFASIPQPDISLCKNLVNITFRGCYQDEEIPKYTPPASRSDGMFSGTIKTLGSWMSSTSTVDETIAFEEQNSAIITNFISIANRVSNPEDLEIEITGQGVGGGCAAQRFTEALSHHFTSRKEDFQDLRAKGINLYCFDAATIEEPIVQRFIKNCMTLSELNFTLRYFSSHIRKLTWYGGRGSHFLGYLDSTSTRKASNVEVTWIKLSFLDKNSNPVEQLSDLYPESSSSIERFYEPKPVWGNNDPFFMERNKYEMKKGNPVHVEYYCTTTRGDHKLIKRGKKVNPTDLPEVLTAGYTTETRI